MLVDRIRSYGPDASIPGKQDQVNGGNLDVHPEYTKAVIFDLFQETGIDCALYSPVVGVVKAGDTVTGLVAAGKEGPITFRGQVTVDATGDGDVAALAGCSMAEGREEDGRHMPMTLVFALAGVDKNRFFRYWSTEKGRQEFQVAVAAARETGDYQLTSWYGFDETTIEGVVSVNNGGCAELDLEATRTADLTAMERLGLRLALDFIRFARDRRVPGMETASLVRTASFVAVRDTRRLVGEYVLQEEDIMKGKEFDDRIARKYGSMDAVGFLSGERIHQGASYPFRSLLPRSVENLLVAGRCGSASFLAHAGGKSMGNMIALGQGAGVCAAIAAGDGTPVRRVDVVKAQTLLRAWGVDI